MESYIRPGCVVLAIYASMSSSAWEQVSQVLEHVISVVNEVFAYSLMVCF